MNIDQMEVLSRLNFERKAGTIGEKQAIDVIVKELDKIGIDYSFEEFEINTDDTGTAKIEIGNFECQALPLGTVNSAIVDAPFLFLENLDILLYNPGIADGAIVLFYELTSSMAKIRKENNIVAFIRMGKPNFPEIALNAPQKNFEGVKDIPMVSVTFENACKLRDLSGSNMKITIQQNAYKAISKNIVVKIKGTTEDKNVTYAVAHYDTTPGNHGASDNGAGTVNLLGLIEYFVENKPLRDLVCVFFSGEEFGLCGSEAHVNNLSQDEKTNIRLVVNIDMSGDAIGTNCFMITGTNEIKGYVGAIAREDGFLFQERLDIYSSDNMPFAYEEIPSVNIARFGNVATASGHSAADTFENIDAKGLAQTGGAALSLLKRILNAKIYPINKEIDGSLRSKIEKYCFNSRKQIPVLNWRKDFEK